MSKKFNVLTAGLWQIASGLVLLTATFGIWLATERVWIWLGAVGFVLLLWGLAGGSRDDDSF